MKWCTNPTAEYHNLLKYVLEYGEERGDRTDTGTLSVFGYQSRYDISKHFPALTTKKLYWNGVVTELLWFLRGDTNTEYLHEHKTHIWDAWADENGDLGPVYGKQWRGWRKYAKAGGLGTNMDRVLYKSDDENCLYRADQIADVIESIKENPTSRRHIVSAWNVGELERMALPPCHMMFQFYVRGGEYLDCHLYQRSADAFLGVPFNIASYSLLTYMMAQVTDLKPGHFVHSFGDLHIYKNHLEQVDEQLSRSPKLFEVPTLVLNSEIRNIDDFTHSDIELVNYDHYPSIKAPLAI